MHPAATKVYGRETRWDLWLLLAWNVLAALVFCQGDASETEAAAEANRADVLCHFPAVFICDVLDSVHLFDASAPCALQTSSFTSPAATNRSPALEEPQMIVIPIITMRR